MLENNNTHTCLRLAVREIRFHWARSCLLAGAVALTAMISTFLFLLCQTIQDGYRQNYSLQSGGLSHIIYSELASSQADQLAGRPEVRASGRRETLGHVEEELLEYRDILICTASPDYAQASNTFPQMGRMPKSAGEIAMDCLTMDSLGIPRELGAPVLIRWRTESGASRQDQFVLSGYWDGFSSPNGASLWVSESFAGKIRKDGSSYTLGITLHQPSGLERQAGDLLKKCGFDAPYLVNLAYQPQRKQSIWREAAQYGVGSLLLIPCGFLMVYNVFHIAVESGLGYYKRLKALGMTSRQVRLVIYGQIHLLCLAGIPLGWAAGWLFHRWMTPILIGLGKDVITKRFSPVPFLAAAALTWLTGLLACLGPARLACGALSNGRAPSVRKSGKRRRATVWSLAVSGLSQRRFRTGIAVVSLALGFSLLSAAYVRYISYDGEIYLRSMAVSDETVCDSSLSDPVNGRYNPAGQSVDQKWLDLAGKMEGVLETGLIRSQEIPFTPGGEVLEQVRQFFGQRDGEILEQLSYDPDFAQSYQSMLDTGETISILYGVDGLVLDCLSSEILAGEFDAEKFASGDYVLAYGQNPVDHRNLQPTAAPGSAVILNGRKFQVMGICNPPSQLILGKNSRKAAFSIDFFLPEAVFREMFPLNGIRQLHINITPEKRGEAEALLLDYKERTKSTAALQLRSDYQEQFQQGLTTETAADFILCAVICFMGLLNFLNMLLTKTVVRRREFAAYRSLGMSRRQLFQMLALEGALHMLAALAVVIPCCVLAAGPGMRLYYAVSHEWAYTYRFSLTPVLAASAAMLGLASGLPVLCLAGWEKRSLSQRIREDFFPFF